MTAGPLYKVTQTVQLCGNKMLNRKMKLFAGRPGECSMIALRPQEMPDRRDWIAMRCEELQAEKADLPTHLSSPQIRQNCSSNFRIMLGTRTRESLSY